MLCVAICLDSPGFPVYIQRRVGRISTNGEIVTFSMFKFRSMYKDADERLAELQYLNEADRPLFKIKDDPRVTKIGKFIRKHSLASVIIGTPGDGGRPNPYCVQQFPHLTCNYVSIARNFTQLTIIIINHLNSCLWGFSGGRFRSL